MIKYMYRVVTFSIIALIGFVSYKNISDIYQDYYTEESSVVQSTDFDELVNYSAKRFDENSSSQAMYDDGIKTESVHMVIPSGEPIGIYVKTEGVMVIGTTSFEASDGRMISPCEGLFQAGDYITQVDGYSIEDKNSLIDIIINSQGKTLKLKVIRDGAEKVIRVAPHQNKDGVYLLGLWVKDDISGIGTLTFIDEHGFAALGHSINDNDTGTVFSISDGAIYDTNLVNIVKSEAGKPGRLEGMIDYSKENIMGRVEENCQYGINGYMTKNGVDEYGGGEWLPVGKKEEACIGDAYILSAISGEPVYYSIKITDIDISSSAGNKGLQIEVTDQRLLEMTNGIVQGMSGTPIIQNGKLLGAITHVFVKDSTKGYGTFVENMFDD